MSAQKAADEMHLDRWVIEALEADDYNRIGPTVYAKGHLKKYAALLGLPAEEILAGYETRVRSPAAAAASGPTRLHAPRAEAPPARNLTPQQIAVSAAVAVLLLGVLWWKPWHQRGTQRHAVDVPATVRDTPVRDTPASDTPANETPANESPASGAPERAAGAAVMSAAAASPPAVRENTSAPAATPGEKAAATAQSAAASAAPAAEAAVPGAGRARLRLSFSADSWVDVHDATGRRTYAGTGLANSVKTIAGTAPMRVYLGFGSGVQLEINDRVVAIGPQFFAGDVARFEAGADGVLRRDSRGEPAHGEAPRGEMPHVQASSARPTG